MAAESLTTAQAQALYMELSGSDRIPSLSPEFSRVFSDANASGTIVHLLSRDHHGFVLNSVIEDRIAGTEFCDWQAPYNYGGVLVTGPRIPERWAPLRAAAKERGVIAEFHRFHPLSDSSGLRRDQTWTDRETVVIPLSGALDVTRSFKPSALGAMKKATKSGLAVREASLRGSNFPNRYRDLMLAKGARGELMFDARYFESLGALDGVRLFEATKDDEVLGSVVILVGPDIAEYHLGESNDRGREFGATNLLLAVAAQRVQKSGCRWLFLGGGTSTDPDNSLLRFKLSLSTATAINVVGGSVYDDAYYDLEHLSPGRFLHYRI